jgi:hypothetical protein
MEKAMEVERISDKDLNELLCCARGIDFSVHQDIGSDTKSILQLLGELQGKNYGATDTEFNIQAVEWQITEVIRCASSIVEDCGKIMAVLRDVRQLGSAINDRNRAEQMDQMTEATEAQE